MSDALGDYAKGSCGQCHGRGYIGWMVIKGKMKNPIICDCVKKTMREKVKREIAEREKVAK